jgi:Zn-dependent protease/CBS domain-containing protein
MISEDIRLGHIAGFRLGVNWSVLVIVWLLTWALASAILPETASGYPTAVYWLAGLAGAIVFFGSLLAHELAHAVMARRAGLDVEGLTLWLFGGVAKLGGQPPTPRADLRIAAIGPATSLVLGGAFGLVAVALAGFGAPDLLVAVTVWLAAINLLLGVFNLIPGAPLDGGRVLRALLWRRYGDWTRAALAAARAGRAVGYGLVGLGLLQFLVGAGLGGLWMMLIGWFILMASRAEQSQVIAEHALRGVRIGDVMTRDPHSAPGWITVDDLVESYLLGRPHSSYPVTGPDGEVEGLVTLRQLRSVTPADRATTRVADVAHPLDQVPTAAPAEALVDALERSDGATGGRFLVFDDGKLVGIVSPADIARAIEVRSVGDGRAQPSAGVR